MSAPATVAVTFDGWTPHGVTIRAVGGTVSARQSAIRRAALRRLPRPERVGTEIDGPITWHRYVFGAMGCPCNYNRTDATPAPCPTTGVNR